MQYAALGNYLPDLAENETRKVTLLGKSDDILDFSFGLVEMYCTTPGCDCRRVMFSVISDDTMKKIAIINYGWESRKFYIDWMGDDDKNIIDDLKGPCLNLNSPFDHRALGILEVVKDVLRDKAYVERLKKHYRLFKREVDKNNSNNSEELSYVRQYTASRNEPCHCGSGKKYKKCCLKN